MGNCTKTFREIEISDIPVVGGKNASLGEMFSKLTSQGIAVPDGFALTSTAYWHFLGENLLQEKLIRSLSELQEDLSNLQQVGAECRSFFDRAKFPESIRDEVLDGYKKLIEKYGPEISLAVRSSATAEDLPNASFAGQQETFLNIRGDEELLKACKSCYASLFTDRAIEYRKFNGFDHMQVALSIGIQIMVRSDKACSGVMFTIDPDSGFNQVVLVSSSWGLGENIVQGNVNPDEYLVYKPFIKKVERPVFYKTLGSKSKMLVYREDAASDGKLDKDSTVNLDTPEDLQIQFTLTESEVEQLASWACKIEEHYGRAMDLEWAKDGLTGKLYIVQARPETVHSQKKQQSLFKEYKLKKKGKLLCSGMGLGSSIVSGRARILHSPSEIEKLQSGEILITERTDPDWDPILKKAAAIITDKGGRTSHAAIVAREVGATAVIGTGNGTNSIQDGSVVTVSTAEGSEGFVYEGESEWSETTIDISNLSMPKTKPMLILAHPDKAFTYSLLPNQGIGLMRLEFIINNMIQIHPMALKHFEKVEDKKIRNRIEELVHHYPNKEHYFIETLAESIARIAAAFYPKDVIVRMSDFKSNEYANLIGGKYFEPSEENPMIGFRGASRYYHPLYQEGFEMECESMKLVRNKMGFGNVKLMLPFVRTLEEAKKVLAIMEKSGLVRGDQGLEIYMMLEIPSNAVLAEDFAKLFDGFSIGSNDLTQLTLGVDRDSTLLSEIFSPFDPAVMKLIEMAIKKAKEAKIKIGLCGQAPSDYPEYAEFLVKCGIDSISFNPDALLQGINNMNHAEKQLK